MKILYVSNPNNPLTQVWVNWFANHGHEVALISDTLTRTEWPGIRIYKLPEKYNTRIIRFIIWEMWTRQIISQWRPDILHAHRVSSAGWLGAYTGFHPFIVTPWGSDILLHPERSIIARYLAQKVLKTADIITMSSELLRNKAVYYGAKIERCKKILWGVDLTIFMPRNSVQLRDELNLGNSQVVFSPRAINPLYNIDMIIESISNVVKEFPNVIYLIQNYNTDEKYRERLLNRIRELDITEHIRWISFEPPERYSTYFQCADVVISVPSSDSIPVTVLEALACGAPVIVSDLPSLREIITNTKNGFIVPVKNHKELEKATIYLLKNPQLREEFYRYNSKWIQENANREIEMGKMEELYFSLIG